MSISAHGSETLAWVCRCRNGVRSASRPVIHILAGENVCIQAIRPMQSGSALAAMMIWWIALGLGEHRLPLHGHRERAGVVELIDDLRGTAARPGRASRDRRDPGFR